MFLLLILASILVTVSPAAVDPSVAADYCTSSTVCNLPNCRCIGSDVPGGLQPANIPQMVLLTFDDAITEKDYLDFIEPIITNRTNPNKCSIKLTFFLSHSYTDYTYVNKVYNMGHEIATHSITHRTDDNFWITANASVWGKELGDMADMASSFANIPRTAIKGSRAPFLLMGGNEMIQALSDNKISWDCTWTTRNFASPGLWPYTLDHRSWQDCFIGRCPTDAFPNFWEVPMNDLTDSAGFPCGMLDTCTRPTTANETFQLLKTNFDSHHTGNKSPFGLFLHVGWFRNVDANGNLHLFQGYLQFLDYLKTLSDTYIVTVSQLVDWVRTPKNLTSLNTIPSWNCSNIPEQRSCNGTRCYYPPSMTPMNEERYMPKCGSSCPPFYPWYGNPNGTSPPTVLSEPTGMFQLNDKLDNGAVERNRHDFT